MASPNFGPRPAATPVDLVVLHSISLPPGEYGGDAVERLFTNSLDWSAHPYYETIRGLAVSAHFFIRRDGELVQFVSCDERAWHAGPSCWEGRADCNDFSVGIELEGLEGEAFEAAQYEALARAADEPGRALSDRRRGRPRARRAGPQERPRQRLRLAAAAPSREHAEAALRRLSAVRSQEPLAPSCRLGSATIGS